VLFALQVLVNIGISSGLFWALIHPIIVYTEVPAYPAWNAAKIISVTVASTISFLSSATSLSAADAGSTTACKSIDPVLN
jgi:hypothetical protein